MVIFCRVHKDMSDVKLAQYFPRLSCYFFSPWLKERHGWWVIFQIHYIEFILDSLLALPEGSILPLDMNYGQWTYFWLSKAHCMLLLSKYFCCLPKLFHQNKNASWSFRPWLLSKIYLWRLEKHLSLLLYRCSLWNYTGNFSIWHNC